MEPKLTETVNSKTFQVFTTRTPLDEREKRAINGCGCTTLEGRSFPNGSNYAVQKMLSGTYYAEGLSIEVAEHPRRRGWWVTFCDDKRGQVWQRAVSDDLRGAGPGVNLGANYCSQDQYLADLA